MRCCRRYWCKEKYINRNVRTFIFKTPKEEKKRQLEENTDTIKPIYEVVKQGTFDCTPEEIYKKLYG